MAAVTNLTPVHFFSHGSSMMLGEESDSATYWGKCGDKALAKGIKHVVMMGAHWATLGNEIEVASNSLPGKSPVAYVHPSKYVPYKLNPDIHMTTRCVELLKKNGLRAKLNDNFAMESPPDAAMLECRQEFEGAMTKNPGPELRRAVTMLMKLSKYRDARGTDDHFMAAMFVAGLCGDFEDRGTVAVMGAEDWELRNMCNSQYTFGNWGSGNLRITGKAQGLGAFGGA
ncbi:uncharacterized protein EAF01_010690 [Botrytis porri]|uniref:Extradiol ring-cleavage dioxygenase class III enzyme subunit B domain-containing protein n=1 Tax=Botrytis porri TaxID=87229 RepID=A0A4Z1KAX4_9HELO|nr:uncharacterized protein EAF01_010690 [Botrytis porri]KAF7890881.1 hypothetical protein EAF01_010690 [Botrytis porri]TGO82770.1 hypothetical protein BPOR_0762g00030 [Botrytis porri]